MPVTAIILPLVCLNANSISEIRSFSLNNISFIRFDLFGIPGLLTIKSDSKILSIE